jgi:predicted alpha/beta-hydrolase family hydrolase
MCTWMAILASLVISVPIPALAEVEQLTTPRGDRIDVMAEFPAGATAPVPTVVLAPGANYPMRQPLMEATARELLARGVAVWRFDWAYTTRQPAGRPSARLADEVEDMRAVIEKARHDPRVSADRLFVAGKSLGSGVAWQLMAAYPALRGAVLLTPVCSEMRGSTVVSVADDNYPGLAQERRPLLFIAGDRDPLCEPASLYRFAAAAGGPARVAVLGGNHGLEQPGRTGDVARDANRRNAQRVGQLVADFIEEQLP